MNFIHQNFQHKLPLVIELLKLHHLESAYLFGSVLTDQFNDDSDVDFIVNFKDNVDPLEKGELMWNLRFALEDTLNRKIDLLTEKSLKNSYFLLSITLHFLVKVFPSRQEPSTKQQRQKK